MTVYVDPLQYYSHNDKCLSGNWCHMMTDGPIDELHKMAHRIGLKREWFQDHPLHPHYDLRSNKRLAAIILGAKPTTSQDIIKRCSKLFK